MASPLASQWLPIQCLSVVLRIDIRNSERDEKCFVGGGGRGKGSMRGAVFDHRENMALPRRGSSHITLLIATAGHASCPPHLSMSEERKL